MSPIQAVVGLLLALLVAIEAATLQRWTLAWGGWTDLGAVVGDDLEAAERRFFSAWTRRRGHRDGP